MPEQRGRTSLKWKWLTILDGDLKMTFNLQCGKVLSIASSSPFLIFNDFLPRNGKTQTNSFFGTMQIFGCLINTLPKCNDQILNDQILSNVFSFLGKKFLEIKKRLQCALERTLPYYKLEVIFKSPSKIASHFLFKEVLP